MSRHDRARAGVLRAAYTLLLHLASPFYVARLLWRGRAEPLYRRAIGERFGHYAGAAEAGALWLHAVSLGETLAAAPLVAALRGERPGLRLLLTHGTATGRAAGRALLRPGDVQVWLPVDTPGAVRRFLDRFRPALGVLMETEVWPNLLAATARRGLPVVLANARLSQRSRDRGRRFDAVLRPAFASLRVAFAQSADDAARLRDAGTLDVRVVGNLKFDLAPDEASLARGRAWRAALARPIVLAAVTREGEEEALLRAWRDVDAGTSAGIRIDAGTGTGTGTGNDADADADAGAQPLLAIVPRHPQRFDAVAALVAAAGFTATRRSDWRDDAPDDAARRAAVWIGDSMREMAAYYAAADVALLGGSFAPFGGQNLIEAAACGCPLVMGPHTYNFADAAAKAEAAGAAVRAADLPAALATALGWLGSDERERRSRAGTAFAGEHGGAAQRMAAPMLALFDEAARRPSR